MVVATVVTTLLIFSSISVATNGMFCFCSNLLSRTRCKSIDCFHMNPSQQCIANATRPVYCCCCRQRRDLLRLRHLLLQLRTLSVWAGYLSTFFLGGWESVSESTYQCKITNCYKHIQKHPSAQRGREQTHVVRRQSRRGQWSKSSAACFSAWHCACGTQWFGFR